jgi:hypothetical protein
MNVHAQPIVKVLVVDKNQIALAMITIARGVPKPCLINTTTKMRKCELCFGVEERKKEKESAQ